MTVDETMIGYLEDLSRLRLSGEEKQDAGEQLGRILAYMDTLAALDTGDAEPMSHPSAGSGGLREDVVTPSADRDAILAGAPGQKDGCFQVPQTVQ